MKNYLYLIFIIFSFCIDANEMDAPPSYFEFQITIQDLNIRNQADYVNFFITEGRELGFPSLKQIPKIYQDEWKGWNDLFENEHKGSQDSTHISIKKSGLRWITYKSFITLMRAEGIDNSEDYRNWYAENRDIFNVPEHPEEAYPKLKNWGRELQKSQSRPVQKPNQRKKVKTINKKAVGADNQKKRVKPSHRIREYLSYTELKDKVQALGITSYREYKSRYKEILGASSRPDRTYKKEWEGWPVFLGKQKRQYLSYTELQRQVQALGIKSHREYKSRYKKISGAPSHPYQIYKKEWEGWVAFLGTSSHRKQQYLSYTELQRQVQVLGITSQREYQRRYKEIPGAPSHPYQIYKEEWKNWSTFLGKQKRQYFSYTELQRQVQALGIANRREYKSRYKEIPGAPSHPDLQYKGEWKNWPAFLGKQCKEQFR